MICCPVPLHFAGGTLCAGLGLLVISAYYLRAWRGLQDRANVIACCIPKVEVSLGRHQWPELRYLQWGVSSSVLFFMLAGAADTENDWLFRMSDGVLCSVVFRDVWSGICLLVESLERARVAAQESKGRFAAFIYSTRRPLASARTGSHAPGGNACGEDRETPQALAITVIGSATPFALGLDCSSVLLPVEGPKPRRSDVTGDFDGFVFFNHSCGCRFQLLVDNLPNSTPTGTSSLGNWDSQRRLLLSLGATRRVEG